MKFIPQRIPEVIIIEPKVYGDSRGSFMESFRLDHLEAFLGHRIHFCQDNESVSQFGVLRGLHYQEPPHTQTKLVRVIQGSVLDVAVDIRPNSPTFGQHVAEILSAENKRQLFIPKGFAHGFVVLSKQAIFQYKVDTHYHPASERGIAYNDPLLRIDWLLSSSELTLSEKDSQLPLLHLEALQNLEGMGYEGNAA